MIPSIVVLDFKMTRVSLLVFCVRTGVVVQEMTYFSYSSRNDRPTESGFFCICLDYILREKRAMDDGIPTFSTDTRNT